jgi:hypothetical protein
MNMPLNSIVGGDVRAEADDAAPTMPDEAPCTRLGDELQS